MGWHVLYCVGIIIGLMGEAPALGKMGHLEKATFSGGCFWCIERPYDEIEGVLETISGFTGGSEENPTYEQVSSGVTGHREANQIIYDPEKVSYQKLLEVFWRQIDPTDDEGQFVDRGRQYRSAIFYHTEAQKKLAYESKRELEKSGRFSKSIVTDILPVTSFYKAEDYHQNYYQKNPVRYHYYRYRSGRDQFLEKAWKPATAQDTSAKKEAFVKPSKEELKQRLTPIQYEVTQKEGTEPPFENEFWNNKEPGIYVDVVSGEPLFSSLDKFDSKTGWPSFTKPLVEDSVVLKKDFRLFLPRTEVRSKKGEAHLGHVFKDGPAPTGLRYCINSASLRFIPVDKLKENGLEAFEKLFSK